MGCSQSKDTPPVVVAEAPAPSVSQEALAQVVEAFRANQAQQQSSRPASTTVRRPVAAARSTPTTAQRPVTAASATVRRPVAAARPTPTTAQRPVTASAPRPPALTDEDKKLLQAAKTGALVEGHRLLFNGKARADAISTSEGAEAGMTPLMLAVQYGHGRFMELLFPGNRVGHVGPGAEYQRARANLQRRTATVDLANPRNGLTALMIAAKYGQLEMAQRLLKHRANLSVKSREGNTALDYAREKNVADNDYNSKMLVRLLEDPQGWNTRNNKLRLALWGNKTPSTEEIKGILAEDGVYVDAIFDGDNTALIFACRSGLLEIVKLLVDSGADVQFHANSAIHVACKQGHLDVVKFLLDQGVPVDGNLPPLDGMTPLLRASDPDIVRLLLEKGANPLHSRDDGRNGLLVAVDSGNLDVAKIFLAKSVDVNSFHGAIGSDGTVSYSVNNTALVVAARKGDTAMMKHLLQHYTDNPQSKDDKFPHLLNYAFSTCCGKGDLEIIQLMLNLGAEVENPQVIKEKYGITPLLSAAGGGNLEIVELLLEKGANLNAKYNDGSNALLYAVHSGKADMVRFFLGKGLDVNEPISKYGHTVLIRAAGNGNAEMVKLLLDNCADVNAKTGKGEGRTALINAVQKGSVECVEILLRHGADKTASLRNKSVLDLAKAKRNPQIISMQE